MRCDCCNRNLNDYEATLKAASTGDYLNTCQKCLDGLGIEYVGREDLNPSDDMPEDFDWDDYGDYDDDFEDDAGFYSEEANDIAGSNRSGR